MTIDAWWLATPVDNNAQLSGLSSEEAKLRLLKFGSNSFISSHQKSLLLQLFSRFKNPLVITLLFAGGISAFTGEVTNCIIISSMVMLSVTLDFFQEYRANQAAEKLKLSVELRVKAVRNGKSIFLALTEVVPGDIVLLSAGDLIPADGVVIESHDFFVKQALLTGEPYPVEKHADIPSAASLDHQSATNAVFMGTSVLSGNATICVVKTGSNTAIGGIAKSISKDAAPTSFDIGIRNFGMLIMRLTVIMVLFVLLVNIYLHKPWLESFLFALALAVGLTPELLPMIISVTLSNGAIRMGKKRMIVKRLSAIQDLGSMDVLCTDKTGTLTEAKIHLEKHVDATGNPSERVLELAYLNSFFETGIKSPLDDAILDHQHIDLQEWIKVDEVPFDFERRRVSVLIDNGKTRWLVVKGAAEEILGLCSHIEISEKETIFLEGTARASMIARYQALEAEGYRVLGIAWREVPRNHPHAVVSDESELVLAGFAGFLDPPKASAAFALASLARSGVLIKIVTGDSDLVAKHVCAELNIPVTGILIGKDIEALDDFSLQAKVEDVNLFCRVNPAQKERVIMALRARGHVVGYLGDGINDAPSLHAADVGLSVDSAVDVAKEAADMILLEQDLNLVYAGVLEGRRTFGNIMKYIMMGTSSNFGNMFSMAGASLFLPFLPMLPTQILLNNMLYDISEVPIPLDQVDAHEMTKPRSLDIGFIQKFMLAIGPISSMFDFLTFYVLLVVLKANEELFQTGWFIESLCTQVLVIFIIRTTGNPLKSRAHPLLTTTSLTVVGMAIGLPFTPIGAYFGLVTPPANFYITLGMIVIVYILLVELAKQKFYRWWASRT